MALINRITRLFRADFNAVLDRIEEPESLLKDAIREMELLIENDTRQSKHMEQEKAETNERLHVTEQSLLKIDKELDLCFETNNEVLARKLVKRKLETQRYCQLTIHRHRQIEKVLEDIESRLNENRDRLSTIKQKLELLDGNTLSAESKSYHPDNYIFIQDDEVEIAFIQEKQQRIST
jgi:phage shock protein A